MFQINGLTGQSILDQSISNKQYEDFSIFLNQTASAFFDFDKTNFQEFINTDFIQKGLRSFLSDKQSHMMILSLNKINENESAAESFNLSTTIQTLKLNGDGLAYVKKNSD